LQFSANLIDQHMNPTSFAWANLSRFSIPLRKISDMQRFLILIAVILLLSSVREVSAQTRPVTRVNRSSAHHEIPDQPYRAPGVRITAPGYHYRGTGFFTTQVNVAAGGANILGDAANEPSIAVNPLDPNQIVVGWRQFDDVNNNFRQAGWGFSSDAGQTWTFPGVIDPGIFRSDPVLDANADGSCFYNSLTTYTGDYTCDVYKSTNGGAQWGTAVQAHGGDKQWMTIDASDGPGRGNIYSSWNVSYSSCLPGFFTRSADAGASFEDCIEVDGYPYWGTMAVGPFGELYVAGAGSFGGAMVVKSTNAQVPGSEIAWNPAAEIDLDGYIVSSDPINPVGLLGQVYVDVDRSAGSGRGNVYVVASVARASVSDPADVMFARSTNGGATFEPPVRINNDVLGNYQWFGTMSVAPNGRIDVIWLDTRDNPGTYLSSLYYCYSDDQGVTWSINKQISDAFDPSLGYPQQSKMGDYFDMVSDNDGAHLAWANTFNQEEDVYYTHIIPTIVGLEENTPNAEKPALSCTPNPFTGDAMISYTLPSDGHVRIDLCSTAGVVLHTLVDREETKGFHTVGLPGNELPAGFYLCRMKTSHSTVTGRVIKAG